MNIKRILVAAAILGIAAGASASNVQSDGGATAANSQKPLQISALLSGPTWLYYKNRNRYHSLAYADHVKIFNKFTAVSFINTGLQPIQQVTFELAAYNDGYRAVLGPNGQPVVKQLIANGPFAPGAKQTLVNANVVWSIPPGNGLGCVRLNGMQIVYADGSSTTVSAAEAGQYFPPQLSNHCGVPPPVKAAGPHSPGVGPSPYIAGVYPAQWMITGLSRAEWSRQSYVAPSETQFLCPVGSLVEETCIHTANTPSSEDAL